jgi:Mn-dependent DtxR family transcriptional regulator
MKIYLLDNKIHLFAFSFLLVFFIVIIEVRIGQNVISDKGISIAIGIRNRHGLLAEFFKLIGVDEQIANKDAEGLEHHHLHPESIKKIEKLVGIMKDNPSLLDA